MKNKYEIRGDVTAIFLNSPKYGNMETFISTRKLEKAISFNGTWCLQPDNSGIFYVKGNLWVEKKKVGNILLHRLLSECPAGLVPDHINGNGLDNRDENIRVVTLSQNQLNRKISKNNTSGVTGVMWSKKMKKWVARVKINGKSRHMGCFSRLEEAEKIVMDFRKEHMS